MVTAIVCVGTISIWLKRLICLCIGKIPAVYTWLEVAETAAKHKVAPTKYIHTRCSATPRMCDASGVWRYDKAEWNFLITLLLLARLFVFKSGTHTYQPLPCSFIHLPALLWECRVWPVRQCPTNELWWERLGSAVGTLLPPLLSLPGNRSSLREGPPSRLLSEWTPNKNSHQQVSYTSHCWFFSRLFIFTPPSLFFIHEWYTALHFGRTEKKDTEKQNSQSVGTFPCSFFFILLGAFMSINSAYTGICAPVVQDQWICFFTLCKNKYCE